MSHYEPSSRSSLDLRTTPSTHVPVREVRSAVLERGVLTTTAIHESGVYNVMSQQADGQCFCFQN